MATAVQEYPTSGATLKDLLPASLSALGVSREKRPLQIQPSRHIVILLIDGLGALQLHRHSAVAPHLLAGESIPFRTEFPSTTPVALGSLGTGLSPGEHGLVAANFWLPDTESMLAPLKWGSDPHPLLVAPETTYFERAAMHGVDVLTVGEEKHRDSGLSRSVLRGSRYVGASELSEIFEIFEIRQRELEKSRSTGLTYIYWPNLDRIGHVHGAGSNPWLECLQAVDLFVGQLAESLRAEATMVVTADHGMLTCSPEHHLAIESNHNLAYGLRRVGGEPRVRHIYVRHGALNQTRSNWVQELADRAIVYTREEVLDLGLYLLRDDEMAERIGDLVVVAQGDYMLTSATDPRTSTLLGQHGGLTPEEMLIPLRQFAGS